MTAAQRQKRRRAKVRRELKAAELERKQEGNRGRLDASRRKGGGVWERALPMPARPPLEAVADELALQVAEALEEHNLSLEDFRAALERRLGSPR
jgi:hypothetical protein